MAKQTIVITGIRPTYQLYDSLVRHYDVAVYDQTAAGQISAQHGRPVICPVQGAGGPLFDRSRNDSALYAAGIVDAVDKWSFGVNGKTFDISEYAPGLALGHLPELVTHLRVLDAYADADDVDIVGVVVHEDVTPKCRALALWARDRGIPAIHVPHANCFAQVRPDIHDESVSDWILATSSYMRDWYVARGFDADRIQVVGYPAWDGWADEMPDQAFCRRVLQLDEDTPTVTLCTGWPQRTNLVDDHEMLDVAVHVTLSAVKAQGWQLIWKLHPGDAAGQEERCARMMAGYRLPAIVTRDHLTMTVRAANVVLSVGPSNVLVEAGMADRTPALFNLRGYGFDGVPPWDIAPDVEQATDTLGGLLDGSAWEKKRARFIGRYAFKNDGKAVKRTVRRIRQIVNASI